MACIAVMSSNWRTDALKFGASFGTWAIMSSRFGFMLFISCVSEEETPGEKMIQVSYGAGVQGL